jgi:ABC-2 type transport system permease protein
MILVSFSYLLREALRFRKLATWLVLGFLSLVLAASWKSFNKEATPTDIFVNVSNILVFRLLPLASAIYTTMVISQEIERKTIVYLLTRPIPRWQLLLGRWAATVTVVVLISVFSTICTYAGAGMVNIKVSLINDIFAILLGSLAYGALFLFVSLVINRALIICVLFAFGWESSIPNLPSGLQSLSILSHMQAIAKHPDPPGGNVMDILAGVAGSAKMNPTTSIFALTLFTVIVLGVSAYWFTTHEYVPREDSE